MFHLSIILRVAPFCAKGIVMCVMRQFISSVVLLLAEFVTIIISPPMWERKLIARDSMHTFDMRTLICGVACVYCTCVLFWDAITSVPICEYNMNADEISFVFELECSEINACMSLLCYMGDSLQRAMTFEQFWKVDMSCPISEMKWICFGYWMCVIFSARKNVRRELG